MAITLDGTLGITSPAETVQGALTTTGNTILGDATTDTLNVGAGGLVKDASGNVGIGTSSPGAKLGVAGDVHILANAGATSHTLSYNENGGQILLYDETGAAATLFDQASNSTRLLELINGSNLLLGLGSANTTGVVQFMGAGYTEQMRIDSAGLLKFNSGYGSVATAYGCRAWVNFNGTGTVAIRGSGNVSSITDNGTGDYTVNFTTAMPDVNYSIAGGGIADGTTFAMVFPLSVATYLVGSVRVQVRQSGNALADYAIVTVSVFR